MVLMVLQSLFYWKSFCNMRDKDQCFNCIHVTILILLEIILQRWRESLVDPVNKVLQSLFYWKSFCNGIHHNLHCVAEVSYNPYFIGNHSATAPKNPSIFGLTASKFSSATCFCADLNYIPSFI